jgi:hypothetical protein
MAHRPDVAPDRPLTSAQLEELRRVFTKLSAEGLTAAYNAAWQKCKAERNGRPPRAEHIQELVQAWKELRRPRPGG